MKNKPIKIEDGEWWYKGCIIQNNKQLLGFQHPRLMRYGVFWDKAEWSEGQPNPYACHTKAEAIAWCNANPCNDSDNSLDNYKRLVLVKIKK